MIENKKETHNRRISDGPAYKLVSLAICSLFVLVAMCLVHVVPRYVIEATFDSLVPQARADSGDTYASASRLIVCSLPSPTLTGTDSMGAVQSGILKCFFRDSSGKLQSFQETITSSLPFGSWSSKNGDASIITFSQLTDSQNIGFLQHGLRSLDQMTSDTSAQERASNRFEAESAESRRMRQNMPQNSNKK